MQGLGATRQTRWLQEGSLLSALAALIVTPALAAPGNDYEVKPFGLISTDAQLSVRYLLDDNERGSVSSGDTFETRTTWEEELFLTSRSYVYHPGFLNMEIGGGPLLVQQEFAANPGSARNDETLVNFLGRLNFLELKNYPVSLYYRRSHPSVVTSLSGRFLTRNNEYGISGQYSGLDRRANLKVALGHWDSEGSGFGNVVDEDVDRAVVNLVTSYRDSDQLTIDYNQFTQTSLSGSTGLPIQESVLQQKNLGIISRNRFGQGERVSVDQSLFVLQQDRESTSLSETENFNYSASVRMQNTDALRTFAKYRLSQITQTQAESRVDRFNTGATHTISDAFWYDVNADYEVTENEGFERDRAGIGGGLNFSTPTPLGTFGLGIFVRGERNDQVSGADSIRVIDEAVTLDGTTPVDLVNEFVIAPTVAIRNLTSTQTFVENVDYRLIVVGSVTSIQRLIDGNINDGETVLVDYEYSTTGTAKFDTFSSEVNGSLHFLKYFNARLRFGLQDSTIREGQLNTPINDREAVEAIFTADIPIGSSWTVGGEFRHTDQDEEISPFVRDSILVTASTRLGGSLRLHASAGLVQVDQEYSDEDVDQVTYLVGISGRLWGRMQVSLETSYLEDTGGTLFRELLQHRVTIQGRYRKLRYLIRARISDDTLGLTTRDYAQFTATVIRDF